MSTDNQKGVRILARKSYVYLYVSFPTLKMEKWLDGFLYSSSPSKNCEYQQPHTGWIQFLGKLYMATGFTFYCLLDLRDFCSNTDLFRYHAVISDFPVILLLIILWLIKVVHQSYCGLSYHYMWLSLKIKYKHLYLHLLQSPSSYFLPMI